MGFLIFLSRAEGEIPGFLGAPRRRGIGELLVESSALHEFLIPTIAAAVFSLDVFQFSPRLLANSNSPRLPKRAPFIRTPFSVKIQRPPAPFYVVSFAKRIEQQRGRKKPPSQSRRDENGARVAKRERRERWSATGWKRRVERDREK